MTVNKKRIIVVNGLGKQKNKISLFQISHLICLFLSRCYYFKLLIFNVLHFKMSLFQTSQ